jgi:hypothetical protein
MLGNDLIRIFENIIFYFFQKLYVFGINLKQASLKYQKNRSNRIERKIL